jgi:predicted nucleic acid-binding protein
MTCVFVDTNVLLDVLVHREPFVHDSAQVLNMGIMGKVALFATPLTFATCLFVARKSLGYTNAISALKILEQHIKIATMDASQLHEALYTTAPDFEDMLQYQAAAAARCKYIVTRDEHHFPQNGISVLTPTVFLQTIPIE